MIVNHGAALKKEYFISYLRLIMNARQCTLPEAKDFTFRFFFHQNKGEYGQLTYDNFLSAFSDLQEELY